MPVNAKVEPYVKMRHDRILQSVPIYIYVFIELVLNFSARFQSFRMLVFYASLFLFLILFWSIWAPSSHYFDNLTASCFLKLQFRIYQEKNTKVFHFVQCNMDYRKLKIGTRINIVPALCYYRKISELSDNYYWSEKNVNTVSCGFESLNFLIYFVFKLLLLLSHWKVSLLLRLLVFCLNQILTDWFVILRFETDFSHGNSLIFLIYKKVF